MATANLNRSLLVVPYEWILENVEKDFKTVASQLILFQGEKVFRLALKNSDKPNGQLNLFFLGINLNKIGLKISDVVCGKEGVVTHSKMNVVDNSKEGHLQLFTSNIPADYVVDGKCTFIFKIQLEGIVPEYSYNPCDLLAKEQLWSAANSKLSSELYADVEFIVQDKRFSAHKAILAARSPVFRAEFANEKPKKSIPANENPHQIRIDDVDASSLEQFLYFVYTGELMTPLLDKKNLANEELLKLATRYQLKTLENLCRNALLDVSAEQMISLVAKLKSFELPKQETNFNISPKKPDTEVFADNLASTLECCWKFQEKDALSPTTLAEYRNERMFFAQLKGQPTNSGYVNPFIGFFFVKTPRNCSLFKISEITMAHKSDVWIQMKPQPGKEDKEINIFTAKLDTNVNYYNESIVFRVEIVNTVKDDSFGMVDTTWASDLLSEKQLTDVEIIVGEKTLQAHRVVLAARSPVFKTLLSKISNTGKSTLTINLEIDFDVVEHFLKYLYTGSLSISANNKQLFALADIYQVATLKEICQLAVRVSDVDDITTSVFSFI